MTAVLKLEKEPLLKATHFSALTILNLRRENKKAGLYGLTETSE